MHAYRRRNQLILFDEVDVNTQIEVTTAGQKIVKPLLVRAANRKSIEELTNEIRAGQGPEPSAARRYRAALAFVNITIGGIATKPRYVDGNLAAR